MNTTFAKLAAAVLIFFTNVGSAGDTDFCLKKLGKLANGPTTLPDAPTRTIPLPTPKPSPAPTPAPTRRYAPDPFPQRTTPPGQKPKTDDPKDIVPIDLYEKEPGVDRAFRAMPAGMKTKMTESARNEEAALEREFGTGRAGLVNAMGRLQTLLSEIKELERPHKRAIARIVEEMMKESFGEENAKQVQLRLGTDLPERRDTNQKPAKPGESLKEKVMSWFKRKPERADANQMTEKQLDFFVYRRELYNSLSQASGWNGMQRFIHLKGPQLDALAPGLSAKYAELHKLFRMGNYKMLGEMPNNDALRGISRDGMSHGREITVAEFEQRQSPDGQNYLEPKNVKGQAVGVNGWALAHEGMKSGFEVSTILEATQRSKLTTEERDLIDYLTNSNNAEVRQGIYGPAIDRNFRDGLKILLNLPRGTEVTPAQYHSFIERVFSILPESKFRALVDGISDPGFATNPTLQTQLRAALAEFEILD